MTSTLIPSGRTHRHESVDDPPHVCHLIHDDERRYCDGLPDPLPHCSDWEGESVCPDCGRPMCSTCVTLAELDDAFDDSGYDS